MNVEIFFNSGERVTIHDMDSENPFAKSFFEDDCFCSTRNLEGKDGSYFLNMQYVEYVRTSQTIKIEKQIEKQIEEEQEPDEQNSSTNRTGLFDWLLSFRSR